VCEWLRFTQILIQKGCLKPWQFIFPIIQFTIFGETQIRHTKISDYGLYIRIYISHRIQCSHYMLTFGFVPNNLDIAFGKANVFKNQIHSKSHSSRLLCLWFCGSTQGTWCSETSFLATLVVSAAHKIWVATAIASTSAAQVISDGIVVPSFWPCQYSLRLNTYENISHCIAETWFQQAFQSLP